MSWLGDVALPISLLVNFVTFLWLRDRGRQLDHLGDREELLGRGLAAIVSRDATKCAPHCISHEMQRQAWTALDGCHDDEDLS